MSHKDRDIYGMYKNYNEQGVRTPANGCGYAHWRERL